MHSNNTLEKWEEKTLGEICTITSGQSPESQFYNTEANGLPFYQGKKEFTNKYIGAPCIWTTKITKEAQAGDILMSVRAPVGPINYATERCCIGRGLASIRKSEKISNDFLFYYLLSIQEEIGGHDGAVFNSISRNEIATLKIKLPPISEQQRIVGILDAAFGNIEKAKQNTLQNLNNAKELFESYLDKVFTMNADNWNKYKVKDVCKYVKEQGYYNLPYVGMEHIKGSTAEFIGTLDNTAVKSTTFHFDKGIILYGRLRPYLRKVILTTFEGHCSTELFPIKVNEKVNNKFLMYWLLSQRITNKINATWTGARMPRANMNQVLEFDISVPNIAEQQKIVHQLDELQEQTKKLEQIYTQKLQDLDELKQSILQKAFNGEL